MTEQNSVDPKINPKSDVVVSYHYFTLKKATPDGSKLTATRMNHKIEMGYLTWMLKEIYSNDCDQQKITINLNSFKNECIMCYDEQTDILIYPCRHLSIGFKCAESLRKSPKCNECPVCRAKIERFIKINL